MSEETSADDETPVERGLFPVNPRWFKIGFYLFLLAWLAYILAETLAYTKFEDLLFPYLVGVPIAMLILLQLFVIQFPDVVDRLVPERRGASTAAGGEDEIQERLAAATQSLGTRRSKSEKEWYELVMLAWVFVLPFMMFFIGMGWTLILYVFAFTWYFVRDIKLAALVTAIVTVFVYVLFIHFLGMIIWTGEWGVPDPLRQLDLLL